MEELELRNSETQAIIDLASSIKPIEVISQDHIKRIALPPGWEMQERDDERMLSQPARKRGTVILDDSDSLIEYINRHKIAEQTTIYCQADYGAAKVLFNCIINDHCGEQDGQQWRDYRAQYEPKQSVEWKRWIGNDKNLFSQFEFATFIEDNLQDIAAVDGLPTGQQLLEMALSFQATQDMKYKSAIRLQNGGINMSFVQDEDNQTLTTMKLFEKVAIGIPVFWNGDAYQITARLRYRVKEGVLKFWYELIRPDRVMEDATDTLIKQINISTAAPLYFGTP